MPTCVAMGHPGASLEMARESLRVKGTQTPDPTSRSLFVLMDESSQHVTRSNARAIVSGSKTSNTPHAALRRYSLMSPPRTSRRRIFVPVLASKSDPGPGGLRSWPRCGLARL